MPQTDRREWHLEKTVSIGHILTTLVIMVGAFGAWNSMSERLSVLETQYVNLSERVVNLLERQANTDARQDESIQQFRGEIRQDIRGINEKLDRIATQTSK